MLPLGTAPVVWPLFELICLREEDGCRFFAGGAKTTITYVRAGQTREADVTLGTYKS